MDRILFRPDVTNEELKLKASGVLSQALILAKEDSSNLICSETLPDTILSRCYKVLVPFVQKIEHADPGGRFGLNKVSEMDNLVDESVEIGKELGLDKNKINILKIVLGTHDTGRFVEKVMNLDTLRAGVRHGAFSVLLLQENNLLDGLSAKDKYIVLFSDYYHAEKDVPVLSSDTEEFEKTAYELCYVLRDMDKEFNLGRPEYFEEEGISSEIKAHYLPGIDPEDWAVEIEKIMEGNVDGRILEYFDRHETAPIQLIKHSWASYMAFRLAMIFDVKNDAILKKIMTEDKKYIDMSINFIRSKDFDASEKISKSLKEYLAERMIE